MKTENKIENRPSITTLTSLTMQKIAILVLGLLMIIPISNLKSQDMDYSQYYNPISFRIWMVIC